MAYNQTLADRVESYLRSKSQPFESKKMMGGLAFMVNGKMCVGVEKDRLMLRIDPAEQEAALARPGCSVMDFTGRPMRGFVFVSVDVVRDDRPLADWLNLALAFNPRARPSRRSRPR